MIDNNIMTFSTDDEFTNFCISSNPVITKHEKTNIMYYDYPYNQQYLDAVNNGIMFNILEANSKVLKRKCVCNGVITKPVSNLYNE